MTTVLINNNFTWSSSYTTQAIIWGLLAFIALFIPNKFFSSTLKCVNMNDENPKDTISLFQHSDEDSEEFKNFFRYFCKIIKTKVNIENIKNLF